MSLKCKEHQKVDLLPDVLKFQLILTTFTSTFGGFVEHLSQTNVTQLSVTQYITMIVRILVTPKAGAKHEVLFNLLASCSLRWVC